MAVDSYNSVSISSYIRVIVSKQGISAPWNVSGVCKSVQERITIANLPNALLS